MAKRIQFRRGTTAQHATFIGAAGELTIDTDKNVVVVHNGVTPGGFPANLGASPTFTGTSTFSGPVRATAATASTSTTTGTVVVTGGMGVSGAIFSGSLTTTTLTETSSIALKENVNPITDALDLVCKLSGVTYDRKNSNIKKESGLIAEDVVKVLPNVVTADEKGNPYGINYTKLIAYLVEAIKDQQRQIDDLKKKV